MPCSPHHSRPGLTLIEVLVIAPIVLIVVAVFIGAIVSMTGEALVSRATNTITYNVQDALSMIEDDVRASNAFLAVNSHPVVSPQGYGNDTTAFVNASTSTGAKLILDTTSTLRPDSGDLSQTPIYLRNSPHPCTSPDVTKNMTMTHNVIYFVRENTLWRRIVMPASYNTLSCGAPYDFNQLPSCHPSQTASLCTTSDARVLEDVSSFAVEYFIGNSTSPAAAASNPAQSNAQRQAALDTSLSARITLSSGQSVAGRDITYEGTVRASRLRY